MKIIYENQFLRGKEKKNQLPSNKHGKELIFLNDVFELLTLRGTATREFKKKN